VVQKKESYCFFVPECSPPVCYTGRIVFLTLTMSGVQLSWRGRIINSMNQKIFISVVVSVLVIIFVGVLVYISLDKTQRATLPEIDADKVNSSNKQKDVIIETSPIATTSASTVSEISVTQKDTGGVSQKNAANGVKITNPPKSTQVKSGSTFVVKVSAPEFITSMFIGSGFDSTIDTIRPFEYTMKVPLGFAGPFSILAVGKDAQGKIILEDTISMVATSDATLISLQIYPDEYLPISVGEEYQYQVTGKFSDGTSRDIKTAKSGTVYHSQDSSIATISVNGLVKGIKPGKTVIAVENGSFDDFTIVEVFGVNE